MEEEYCFGNVRYNISNIDNNEYYDTEVYFADGTSQIVKCKISNAKIVYREPTADIKSHPKYAQVKHLLEDKVFTSSCTSTEYPEG